MKPQVILRNWAVKEAYDIWTPPECSTKFLVGEAYNHPRFENGKRVSVSRILCSIGKTVETNNTLYCLEEPDPTYVAWCKENNIEIDLENPIKLKD